MEFCNTDLMPTSSTAVDTPKGCLLARFVRHVEHCIWTKLKLIAVLIVSHMLSISEV